MRYLKYSIRAVFKPRWLSVKMRKSIRHFPRKRTGRARDANLVETFATRNENFAAAESSRKDNSSHFRLAFRPPVLNHPLRLIELALELREWVRELPESDISLRYALDWRQPRAKHLFPFSPHSGALRSCDYPLCESSRAGKTHRAGAVGAKSWPGIISSVVFSTEVLASRTSPGERRTWISGRG